MASSKSYPPFSFLPTHWDHRPRRNFFLDCGTLGGIYIREDGETLIQKAHECNEKRHLRAQFPSLPLFVKPKYGISDIDLVGQNILKMRNKQLQNLIKRIKELKTMFRRKKSDPSVILNLLKTVSKFENGECPLKSVIVEFNKTHEFENFYKRYSHLLDINDVQKTNQTFTGSLQVVNPSDEPCPTTENGSLYLSAISGLKLDKIKFFKADLEDSGLLNVDEDQMIEIEIPYPLFQLSNQHLYGQSFCAARGKNSCLMYHIFNEKSSLETKYLDEISFNNETLTSICMSPYIQTECLVGTDSGSVFLWNAGKRYNCIYPDCEHLTDQPSWTNVHYGSHPRSIVVTNQKTMNLIDIRIPECQATNLFSIPNPHLKNKEIFRVSKSSTRDPFHHFLATDYALFLLDERFPQYPVLQWQHMMEQSPQYMCLVPGVVQSPNEDVLLLGSQYPPEMMSIQYRTSKEKPPTAVCSPWRISRNIDFLYIDNMHHKIEDVLVKQRLNAACIGIAGQRLNPDGLLIFQLNSLGDIFFQKYTTSTEFGDKTCSAGPGDNVVELSMEAKCRGRYWLDHLRENVQENYFCDAEHKNITSIIESLSNPPASHILCRLCMPQCDNEDIESDDEDVIDGCCVTCNSTLQKSKWIVDGVEQDKVIQSTEVNIEKEFPSLENISKSSRKLTKKLCKLWNEEELSSSEEEEEEGEEEKEGEEEEGKVGEDEEGGGGGESVKSEAKKARKKEQKKEKETLSDKAVEVKENQEQDEEEEEGEVNEQNFQNRSFSFVNWSHEDSEDEEEEKKESEISQYNIPCTLDEPKSPLLFNPSQSETPLVIPESIPTGSTHSSQRLQSPDFSLSKTQSQTQTQVQSILSPKSIPDSPKASLHSQTTSQNFLTEEKQKQKWFSYSQPFSSQTLSSKKSQDEAGSTQDSFSCFLSPTLNRFQTDLPRTGLGKHVTYEEGFSAITHETENRLSSPSFLSPFSSGNKILMKKTPLKRKYEVGF